MLKELLDDIVAKDVNHENKGLGENFLKHHLLFINAGSFELLLDKARAMLIAAKLDDVTTNVVELKLAIALVGAELFKEGAACGRGFMFVGAI